MQVTQDTTVTSQDGATGGFIGAFAAGREMSPDVQEVDKGIELESLSNSLRKSRVSTSLSRTSPIAI